MSGYLEEKPTGWHSWSEEEKLGWAIMSAEAHAQSLRKQVAGIEVEIKVMRYRLSGLKKP